MSQSLGMRRVDVSGAGGAQPGTPLLLTPARTDFYEHSTEGSGNLGEINSQDHAYGGIIYGKYAIVADGGNGLTVYDTTVPADTTTGAHIVANLGGTTTGKPPLGRASSVRLWTERGQQEDLRGGGGRAYGISVVDMTELLVNGTRPGMTLLKTFEPIKIEEEEEEGIHVGSADGKSVDVQIVNDIAYVSYDSFGLVAYRMADLIMPLAAYQPPGQPAGVCAGVDPTKVFSRDSGLDCRPVAVGRYNLDDEGPAFAALEGGAQYMTAQYFPANRLLSDGSGRTYTLTSPRVLLYVAYGYAGVIKLDWSDPAKPVLLQHKDTAGKALANGDRQRPRLRRRLRGRAGGVQVRRREAASRCRLPSAPARLKGGHDHAIHRRGTDAAAAVRRRHVFRAAAHARGDLSDQPAREPARGKRISIRRSTAASSSSPACRCRTFPASACHAATKADGTPIDNATYQPDCADCHKQAGDKVADSVCLGCHQRQGLERTRFTDDVHLAAGMTCMSCHSQREMHGDGKSYVSQLENGAMDTKCQNCHRAG